MPSNLAYILALKGEDMEKALLMAKGAVEKEPGRAAFHHTLGWYVPLGEMEKAMKELSLALEIQPDFYSGPLQFRLANYLSGNFEQASRLSRCYHR